MSFSHESKWTTKIVIGFPVSILVFLYMIEFFNRLSQEENKWSFVLIQNLFSLPALLGIIFWVLSFPIVFGIIYLMKKKI